MVADSFLAGDAISVRTNQRVPINEWTHVAVTYDGSSKSAGLSIYLNGFRAGVETVRDHLTREITGGGGTPLRSASGFEIVDLRGGEVDELLVFDRQLRGLRSMSSRSTAMPTNLTMNTSCLSSTRKPNRLGNNFSRHAASSISQLMACRY